MNDSSPTADVRTFAIIPAAGASRRMGTDKLLLPWQGQTVIDTVIDAWTHAGVDAIVVVAHPENQELISQLRQRQIHLVVPPQPPRQMRESVELGLRLLESTHQPTDADIWLLAPADIPELSASVINQVVEVAKQAREEIVVPVHDAHRGHPAAFRWSLAQEVFALGKEEGVNALFSSHATREIELGSAAIPADIDTPEDYQRLGRQTG